MNIIRTGVLAAIIFSTISSAQAKQDQRGYPIKPVSFTEVSFDDRFWSPRIETNREVTIAYAFAKCEETGRIGNFAKAGGLIEGEFEGIYFNDSDVYKVIEGAAYSLVMHPDAKLEKYVDGVIDKMAAAQEDDGYLYTIRTINPDKVQNNSGKSRWSNIRDGHELYCVGHMYEAAVAYYQATGKRTLLDVAIKNADLIARVFNVNGYRDPPGHQEIEIGLAKLYLITGDEKYLNLAKFFLDERGYAHGRNIFGQYCQDHKPVVEQDEAVGHAVRAGYMYSGMADIAALTGEASYIEAIDKIWRNVVTQKLYLTGGIGARHRGEAFGDNYELPNASAYNETCAAIANAFWNHRMFLLHGDAKYIDVLERVIYNGFLSGISLKGDRFFYPNPLASNGEHSRSPWFGCSCCPVNVVRFIPFIPGYMYAVQDRDVYINLFVAGSGVVEVEDLRVRLDQTTRYPWDGKVNISVEPSKRSKFTLRIRIPGWAQDRPVPSDLYRYRSGQTKPWSIAVNGKKVSPKIHKGYAVIKRTWKSGDQIQLDLPMTVRSVVSHEKVTGNKGKIALEYGPVVYCFEGIDNDGFIADIVLDGKSGFTVRHDADKLGGINVISTGAKRITLTERGGKAASSITAEAIPYYAWAHRGNSPMAVWMAGEAMYAKPRPVPTIASKSKVSCSHFWQGDTGKALNDQVEPKKSADLGIDRFTWWDHLGTDEWVQYDFDESTKVSGVEVYWFDDTGIGQCRVPKSWQALYKDGQQWKPVKPLTEPTTKKDMYNCLSFEPVTTEAIRLEVKLRDNYSSGILEWKVK